MNDGFDGNGLGAPLQNTPQDFSGASIDDATERQARLAQLREQKAQTENEMERLIAIERGRAIERCRRDIVEFNLSALDLGLQGPKSPVRYRSPDGQTWTGLGRKPGWVRTLLAKGGSLADCEVPATSESAS